MKIEKITILLLLISSFGFGQTDEKILLEWKLSKNDTLKYKTTMDARRIENEQAEKTETKDTGSVENMMQQMFKSLAKANANLNYETRLFLNKANEKFIDIEMKIADEKSDNAKSDLKEPAPQTKEKKTKKRKGEKEPDSPDLSNMLKDLATMNNNIVLRGRISTTGEMISSYYKNSQRNLIAILFELPNRKVEVGEKWKLNVNFIEMDQNFFCDSLVNDNSVYIEKIIETKNERIAVVKYNITQYVSGSFSNPLSSLLEAEPAEKSFMKMSHTATGNFSITKGKWISYDGELEVDSNFFMLSGKSKTIFKMTE